MNMSFKVDMAVLKDCAVFQSSGFSKTADKPVFLTEEPQEKNSEKSVQENDKSLSSNEIQTNHPKTPPVLLFDNEKKYTLPHSFKKDTVIPLVSPDNKPGSRLNEEIRKTVFSKKLIDSRSPYNMSEEKAIARKTAQKSEKSKAPENEKIFSMDSVVRYRNNQTKFNSVTLPDTRGINQTRSLLMEKPTRKEKIKTHNENEASASLNQTTKKSFINTENIRSEVKTNGFGYKRAKIPAISPEKTSPAASWFPEAMTRQLDAYEAAKKISSGYKNQPETIVDYNI